MPTKAFRLGGILREACGRFFSGCQAFAGSARLPGTRLRLGDLAERANPSYRPSDVLNLGAGLGDQLGPPAACDSACLFSAGADAGIGESWPETPARGSTGTGSLLVDMFHTPVYNDEVRRRRRTKRCDVAGSSQR